ncbi:MAG: hypothetical protein U0271_39155 [Polyangiaceae bacterium]
MKIVASSLAILSLAVVSLVGCGGDSKTSGSSSAAKASGSSSSKADAPAANVADMCRKMNALEKKKKPDAKDETAECTKNMTEGEKTDGEYIKCLIPCSDKATLDEAETCMKACDSKKKPEPASSSAPAEGSAAPAASAAPSAEP